MTKDVRDEIMEIMEKQSQFMTTNETDHIMFISRPGAGGATYLGARLTDAGLNLFLHTLYEQLGDEMFRRGFVRFMREVNDRGHA
jgi:hypothetical protein